MQIKETVLLVTEVQFIEAAQLRRALCAAPARLGCMRHISHLYETHFPFAFFEICSSKMSKSQRIQMGIVSHTCRSLRL